MAKAASPAAIDFRKFGREIERGDPHAGLARILDGGNGRLASRSCTEGQDGVDGRIGAESGLDLGANVGRIVRDRQHRHLAAEAFREALATQVEGDVADLLVDADADLAAHFLELGAGNPAGIDFVLTHMQERAELLGNVGS